mgnify:CR=1 FL=1
MYLDNPDLDPTRRAGAAQGTSRFAIARARYLEKQRRDRQRPRRRTIAWAARAWPRGHRGPSAPGKTAIR